MNEEPMLRDHFARLRRAEEASTPSFEQVVGLPRRSDRGMPGLAVTASVALVALTVVMLWVSHPHRPPSVHGAAPMLADWHSPTDFLLDTPGRELLHAIPDIGGLPSTRLGSTPPLRTIAPARRAGREHS